jgi:hypothetical protein
MDPVTMAIAAAGMKAVGSIVEGNQANAAAKANAGMARENAAIAMQQAGVREDQSRRRSAGVLGAQYAAQAQAGVDPNSGSALRVLEDDAAQAELDALTIRYEGQTQALGYEREARMERWKGKQARIGGYMNAATSILGGASQAYGMRTSNTAAPGGYTGGTRDYW